MKLLFKLVANKLKYAFTWLTGKPELKSVEEEHWVNHIYDETTTWPNGAMMWANIHGFDEGPGATYWVGIDVRCFGIRTADYIIKCKSKSTYDEYIYEADHNPTNVLYKMRKDSRLNYKSGEHVTTEFIFKWGGEEKTFNVRYTTDHYAEEK